MLYCIVLPVLEPDLDLPLGEAELVRHLYPAPPGEVVVGVELLLQLQRLVPAPSRSVIACKADVSDFSTGSCRR